MTAEEFIVIPKHLYVKEQSHAARVFNDNISIQKNAQLSDLNRLRHQLPPQTSKTTATKETFTENAEPQQNQLDLITEDEEVPLERDKDEILEEKNDSQTESILGQLQVLEDKKFIRANTILEIIQNSQTVTINHDKEVIYVKKVLSGLKAALVFYDIQKPTKKLHNPASIIILTALSLNEKLVVNRNAKQAVQSASFNSQENREPGLSRKRLTYSACQEKTSANLRRSRKQKRKRLNDDRKPRNQKTGRL